MPRIILIGLGPGDPMLLTRAAWDALHQTDIIYTPVPEHPALATFAVKIRPLSADPAETWPLQAATSLLAQAHEHATICCAWQGVNASSKAVATLHAALTQQHSAPAIIPDISHAIQSLPLPPEATTTPRAWSETQALAPYVAPITPVDALSNPHSFDALHYVVARLLAPGGCPWDVQQTHQSLRGNLLEETYEVLEALDNDDMTALAEELGDLLMQVLVHSEMARQAQRFDLGDVLEQITSKLIRRHPHVFGDLDVADEGEVLRNWEHIKAQERATKGQQRNSALDGIPAALPALAACQKIGGRVARAGFDWPTLEQIWGKVDEELAELIQAHTDYARDPSVAHHEHLTEELGDTLYVVVQLARWLAIDAESALRAANAKFCRRFAHVERAAQAQGTALHTMTLEEKLALWKAAKQQHTDTA